MEKNEIIENIHILLSNNVIGNKQIFSRYKGFKGELEFQLIAPKQTSEIFSGGYILSKDSTVSSLINAIYFSCTPKSENTDRYIEIYKKLSNLNFVKMYLIRFSDDFEPKKFNFLNINDVSLPVPKFEIFEFSVVNEKFEYQVNEGIGIISSLFDDKKSKSSPIEKIDDSNRKWLHENLSQFSKEQLTQLYIERLIFDGYLGFSKYRGKTSDIDFIAKNKGGELRFFEIKEKDLPKSSKIGFGLDVPRINDFKHIEDKTGVPYCLIVKHINNQKERALINWKYILISDFIDDVKDEGTVEGAHGMMAQGGNFPTKICSLSKFKTLKI